MFSNKCLNRSILFNSAPNSGIQREKSSSKEIYIYVIVKFSSLDDYIIKYEND